MKKCPYCAEEIQDEAIKCMHCGEFLIKPIKKYAPLLLRENELPEDLREIIGIIRNGQMPQIQGFMKYDFTSKIYLKRSREFFLYAIGIILFFILLVILIPHPNISIVNLLLIGILIGMGFIVIKNFKLYKESRKGNAYLLFTPKYFVIREGKEFQVYKWQAMSNITDIGQWIKTTKGQPYFSRVATQFNYEECPHIIGNRFWLLEILRNIFSGLLEMAFQVSGGGPIETEKLWLRFSKYKLLSNKDKTIRLRLIHLEPQSVWFVEQQIKRYIDLYGLGADTISGDK